MVLVSMNATKQTSIFSLLVLCTELVCAQGGGFVDTSNKGAILGSCVAVYRYTPQYTNPTYVRLLRTPAKSEDGRWENEKKAKQLDAMVKAGERRGQYLNDNFSSLVPPSQIRDFMNAIGKVSGQLDIYNPDKTQSVMQAFDYCNRVSLK